MDWHGNNKMGKQELVAIGGNIYLGLVGGFDFIPIQDESTNFHLFLPKNILQQRTKSVLYIQ